MQRDYQRVPFLVNSFGSELNQVWTNIIDNAIDAMGGKGELRVRTYREDGCVVVEIGDNGPGISPEVEPHIFEPFFTTKGVAREPGWASTRSSASSRNTGAVFRSLRSPAIRVFKFGCRCRRRGTDREE